MTCPHASLSVTERGIELTSDFCSPSGTLNYQCSRCGLSVIDESAAVSIMEVYRLNPPLYRSRLKKFNRLVKKL